MNKAFSATTIKRALTSNPSIVTVPDEFERDSGAPTVASVGHQAAAETLFLLIFFPRQTFANGPSSDN